MQRDYKMFPPSVDWDNIDWSTRRPQMDFPIQVSPLTNIKSHDLQFFLYQWLICDFLNNDAQSAICSLEDVNSVKPGKVSLVFVSIIYQNSQSHFLFFTGVNYQITIKGYAVSGGGRGIERVDVSIDGGKTWIEASKSQKAGIPYISDDESSDKWAWVLFEAEADISESTEIVAKAVC